MSDREPFDPPAITADDEDWAAEIMGLPPNAFRGPDGADSRSDVLKRMDTVDVAACPGSGKTTLLVAKLAILSRKWESPTRGICVLSHTNAARHEIEGKLTDSSFGHDLLSYPHYLGTIHGFVNEFLASPWLRALGYPIRSIDSEMCQKQRWGRLSHASRHFLKLRHMEAGSFRIVDADFSLEKASGHPFPCGPTKSTYQNVQKACKETAGAGFHCYDDAFVWANDLLDKHPGVAAIIRNRFPLVLVDEAQDNSELQSMMLHRVFMDGSEPVIRQRLGDSNQAIYDFVGAEGANTDAFPSEAIKLDLPCSRRFSQRIADLADPLGVSPYSMVGEGPCRLVDNAHGISNVLFLFEESTVDAVLPAYAQQLVDTFPEEELRMGSFVAVGHVHRRPETATQNKFPHYVGDYWSEYDAAFAPRSPRFGWFVQYVQLGQQDSVESGEAHHVVRGIASAVLRLGLLLKGERSIASRSSPHQTVLDALAEHPALREDYLDFVSSYGVGAERFTRADWEGNLNQRVRTWGEVISGEANVGAAAAEFLSWPDMPWEPDGSGRPASNIYVFPADEPKVSVRVGSIHSVKGETHTACLVLETFWNAHNLAKLSPWLTGARSGFDNDGPQQFCRLKTHYVAMTRPSHMLCIAMSASAFMKGDTLDPDALSALESRGWTVRRLVNGEPGPA